jgi:hypothetical protein
MLMTLKLFHRALIALLIQASPVWAVEAGKPLPDLGLAEVQKTKGQYIYIDYWGIVVRPLSPIFSLDECIAGQVGAKGFESGGCER